MSVSASGVLTNNFAIKLRMLSSRKNIPVFKKIETWDEEAFISWMSWLNTVKHRDVTKNNKDQGNRSDSLAFIEFFLKNKYKRKQRNKKFLLVGQFRAILLMTNGKESLKE